AAFVQHHHPAASGQGSLNAIPLCGQKRLKCLGASRLGFYRFELDPEFGGKSLGIVVVRSLGPVRDTLPDRDDQQFHAFFLAGVRDAVLATGLPAPLAAGLVAARGLTTIFCMAGLAAPVVPALVVRAVLAAALVPADLAGALDVDGAALLEAGRFAVTVADLVAPLPDLAGAAAALAADCAALRATVLAGTALAGAAACLRLAFAGLASASAGLAAPCFMRTGFSPQISSRR